MNAVYERQIAENLRELVYELRDIKKELEKINEQVRLIRKYGLHIFKGI